MGRKKKTYLNLQVCVQKSLELKWLLAIVLNIQARAQGIRSKGDTVDKTEIEGPLLLEFLGHLVWRQTEVKLHGVLRLGRLAEELPDTVASKSVLRQGSNRGVVLRGRAKDLQFHSSVLCTLAGILHVKIMVVVQNLRGRQEGYHHEWALIHREWPCC